MESLAKGLAKRGGLVDRDVDGRGLVAGERTGAGGVGDDRRHLPPTLEHGAAVDDVLYPVVRNDRHRSAPEPVSREQMVLTDPVAAVFPLEVRGGRHREEEREGTDPRQVGGEVPVGDERDRGENADSECVSERVPPPDPFRRPLEARVAERLHLAGESVDAVDGGDRDRRLAPLIAVLSRGVAGGLDGEARVAERALRRVVRDRERLDLLGRDRPAVPTEEAALVPQLVAGAREPESVVVRERDARAEHPRHQEQSADGDERRRGERGGVGLREEPREHRDGTGAQERQQADQPPVERECADERQLFGRDGEQFRLGGGTARHAGCRRVVDAGPRSALAARAALSTLDLASDPRRLGRRDEPDGALGARPAGRLQVDGRDPDRPLDHALAHVDVLYPSVGYLPLASGYHSRRDVEGVGGEFVVESPVVRRLVAEGGEKHRAGDADRERKPPVVAVHDEEGDDDEPRDLLERAVRDRLGREPHTASSPSARIASRFSSSRRSLAPLGVSPGICTSAPRDPAVYTTQDARPTARSTGPRRESTC